MVPAAERKENMTGSGTVTETAENEVVSWVDGGRERALSRRRRFVELWSCRCLCKTICHHAPPYIVGEQPGTTTASMQSMGE